MADEHHTTIREYREISETWQPQPQMRWRDGRLQQMWLVETRGYSPAIGPTIHMRHAWRDVPEVPADAE
jgi:hypothetical protein